jgi:hypothetical protein
MVDDRHAATKTFSERTHTMQTSHVLRRRVTVLAVVFVAMIGTGTIASVGVAGGTSRPEASLTDQTAQPAGAFVAVSPLRVLDTRAAPHGPIGVATSGAIAEDGTIVLALAGEGRAIPAHATAAFLNITIDADATVASFLTVWPTGEPRPLTSANNALPGLVASNAMLAKLGDNGSISIFNQQGDVHVVIDLLGYVVPLEILTAPTVPTVPTVPPTAPTSVPTTVPATVPTTVPTVDPHNGLISGTGPPAAGSGSDGDFYLDTANQILFGPKTAGVWPASAVALGGVQGAASAYDPGPVSVPTPAAAPAPIPFALAGPAAGSVSRTDDTTFTVSESGLYRVDYQVGFSSSVSGIVAVFVSGVQSDQTTRLAGSVYAANDLLVAAVAGDTIRLWFAPSLPMASVGLKNLSILVEQTTGV